MPASWKSHSNSTPVASSTRWVASASSGPVPSPGMKVTRWVKTVLSVSVSWGGAFFQGRRATRRAQMCNHMVSVHPRRRRRLSMDQIEREVMIDAPVERVWELVTEAEHLGRWFGDAGAEVDLRPGGTMALHWTEHGTARGRIAAVEPQRLFAFRW